MPTLLPAAQFERKHMDTGTGERNGEGAAPDCSRDGQSPGPEELELALPAEVRRILAVVPAASVFDHLWETNNGATRSPKEYFPRYIPVLFIFYYFGRLPELMWAGFWAFLLGLLGSQDDRKRRGSTTPWNIPPPLAVLWGVCWMFRGQENDPRAFEESDSFPAGGWNELPPTASPLALEGGAWLPDWDDLLNYSTPVLPQQIDAWPLNGQISGRGEPLTNSLALDRIGGSAFEMPSAPGEAIRLAGLDIQYIGPGSSTPMNAHAPPAMVRGNGLAALTRQEDNDPSVSTAAETPLSSASSGPREQTIALGADGPSAFACNLAGCDKTFKSADSLRKHNARHKLRFNCTACARRFGTRSDLERHESTVHPQETSRQWYCTEPSCRRRERGFSRRDNFTKHMRDVHNRTDAVSDGPSRPSAGQKRKRGDGEKVAEADEGERKGDDLQAMKRENEKLRKEVEMLHREREAEARRHREVEDERARELLACRKTQAKLVGMLDRVLSRDNS